MKKLNLVLILFALTFSFLAVGQKAQAEESESPLSLEITGDLEYDAAAKEIKIPVKIKNNTSNYYDNLYYGIELYEGEGYREEGDLFGDLEYSGGDILPLPENDRAIGPNEEISFNILYVHKDNINSGNYFFKIALVNDLNVSLTYSLDYSKSPLVIDNGTNNNLGFFSCYATDGENYYSPSMGMPTDRSIQPEILFSLGSDSAKINSIKNQLKKVSFEVYKNDITEDIVYTEQDSPSYSYLGNVLVNEESVNLGEVLRNKLQSDLAPGTYRIKATFLNSEDEEISHSCFLRWVVMGESARIGSIQTSKNTYKKGENFDLMVSVFGSADESAGEANLEVNLLGEDGEQIGKFTQEGIALGENTAQVYFSDQTFEKNVAIKTIVLNLYGSSGDVIDSREFSYKDMPAADNSVENGIKIGMYILGAIFIILFLVVFIFRKKISGGLKIFIIFGLVFTFSIISAQQSSAWIYIYKGCYPTNLHSWYSSVATSCVSGKAKMIVSISAAASNCMNGVVGSGTVAGTSFGMADQGHVLSATWGPYVGYTTNTTFSSTHSLYYWPGSKTLVNYPTTGYITIYPTGCTSSGSVSRTLDCCVASCSCASSVCTGSTCSDGCGGTCAGTKDCNQAPTATILTPSAGSIFENHDSISFSGQVSDPDGDPISYYRWYDGGCGTGTYLSGQLSFSKSGLSPGSHTVYFRAMDNRSAWSACDSVTFTVRPVCDPETAPAGSAFCPGDNENLTGSSNITAVRVDSSADCTDAQKCEYYLLPVDGAVGTANDATFCQRPTENLCEEGTPSEVTEGDNGQSWNWTCYGLYGGADATGKAVKSCSLLEVSPN